MAADMTENCALIAAQLDNAEQAVALWTSLLERGIYVNLIFPPAAPHDKPLIRCSVSATAAL